MLDLGRVACQNYLIYNLLSINIVVLDEINKSRIAATSKYSPASTNSKRISAQIVLTPNAQGRQTAQQIQNLRLAQYVDASHCRTVAL